jgi:L,D-transpeptidase ErfK/SrfK
MRNLAAVLILSVLFAAPAGATVYEISEGSPEVFGSVDRIRATYTDTLVDLARRFSLGYEEIHRANPGIDPWLPGDGTEVVLPNRRILPVGPREGIVINLPEHRLYYFPKRKKPTDRQIVYTFPVSVGKMDWQTPLGETRIINKRKHPSWHPPESVRQEHAARGDPLPRVVGPGPDNPLGDYAMRLDIPDGAYLIHGTNNPLAVGMAVTHGCIRMYPEDIEKLFPLVPVGTKVHLINQPVKVAYVEGELLLEAHPPVDAQGQSIEPKIDEFTRLLNEALGPTTAAVHWDIALETLQAARGMPVVVGLHADLAPTPLEEQSGEGLVQTAEAAEGATPAGAVAAAPETEPVAPAAPVIVEEPVAVQAHVPGQEPVNAPEEKPLTAEPAAPAEPDDSHPLGEANAAATTPSAP